jgi:DNA-binding CsgD family transcriptional regulator
MIMADRTESPAHIAARVIQAIGRPDFPERLLAAYRDLAADGLEDAGPMLVAALRRHKELIERAAHIAPSRSYSVFLERAHEWGLSPREAEVAAGLAAGRSQPEIAEGCGLALSSVITYRRRAYQKLAVTDRLQLRALCERLAAMAEP